MEKNIRAFLLIIFIIGLLGSGAELLLLEHTEDLRQWIPLTLLATGLLVLGGHGLLQGPVSLRVFQGTMALFVISGFVGIFFHYQGNVEFELEMYPTLAGWALFKKAMQGATPALAPGTMIQLGLLGLAYSYRHPALRKPLLKTQINGETE